MEASPEDWSKSIGKNIRDKRVSKGMTQEALSALMYEDVRTVKRHENGIGLTLNMIPAYAAALNCSRVDLMFANVEINDPVYRVLGKIKSFSEEDQKRIVGIIVQCLGLKEQDIGS